MLPDDIALVRSLPLLAELPSAAFDRLLANARVERFAAQERVIEQGRPAEALHLLVSGSVELTAGTDDRETTVAVLRQGATFLLPALFSDEPQSRSARTLGPSRLIVLPAAAVHAQFHADARFARVVARELAQSDAFFADELAKQKIRSAAERLASWILANAPEPDQTSLVLDLEKRVLASLLGMTPESLSRCFAALSPAIAVEGRLVRLKDRSALADIRRHAQPFEKPRSAAR